MLHVDSVSKTFSGGVHAVQGVSFSVDSGEILGVLGPNGAGKTTTIRMVLNIIAPDSGKISVDGKPLAEHSKDTIGYLPEERGLYKKSTIGSTLTYFGKMKGMSDGDLKKGISDWLERFNLQGMEKRKVEELSKGNQQKVQFIASVLHTPKLLILDEPFSGLDPINQVLFKEAVSELRNKGMAIIFCTHQLESAETFCDRFFLINKGERVLYGTLSEIRKSFPSQEVEIGFSENTGILNSISGIDVLRMNDTSAIVRLHDENNFNTIAQEILSKIKVNKVIKMEPSLLNIFMSVVPMSETKNNHAAKEMTR